MTTVAEIAPDVFRLSTYVPEAQLQFNQFLIRDDEPMLYHAGLRTMFPALREAVARVLDPARLRWIGFSHFEADECGALNEWLALAPNAGVVCGVTAAAVNLSDFSLRPPHNMTRDQVLVTGTHRFRFHATPHLPHGWDSVMLFEENHGILFCSDLFHQNGDVDPLVTDDLLERTRDALRMYEAGPMPAYVPHTSRTERLLNGLAMLTPATLAVMHGSSFSGDGARALRGLAGVLREVSGGH